MRTARLHRLLGVGIVIVIMYQFAVSFQVIFFGPRVEMNVRDDSREIELRTLKREETGHYCFQLFAWPALAPTPNVNVTLATHLTPSHLLESAFALSRWSGAGSVAVFITSQSEYTEALDKLYYLRRCNLQVIEATDYHFVFPCHDQTTRNQFFKWVPDYESTISCVPISELASPEPLLQTWSAHALRNNKNNKANAGDEQNPDGDIKVRAAVVDEKIQHSPNPGGVAAAADETHQKAGNYMLTVPYPNNMLRNIAVFAALTELVSVLDADMVPSATLASTAQSMLQATRTGDKIALVIPAFEVEAGSPIPTSKSEMLELLASQKAQPFYHDMCAKCQNTTDFVRWAGLPPLTNDVYEVAWRDPWEPLYVSRRGLTPAFDERFKQYGFNRISQACEMHVAGFKFLVLTDEFVVHPGFKTKDFHPSKAKEQEENRILFRLFKKELKKKYPDVARRCY